MHRRLRRRATIPPAGVSEVTVSVAAVTVIGVQMVRVMDEDLAQAGWVSRVSDAGVARVCGRPAYERGQGYADAERVHSITTGDQGRLLLASVGGSRGRPYSTMVTALGSDSDGEPAWTGRCSCPVGVVCKHVAALVLAAREQFEDGLRPHTSWRRDLDRALSTAQRQSPTRGGRGSRRAEQAASPRPVVLAVGMLQDPRGNLREVQVRPTRRNKNGSWNRTLTWDKIADPYRGDQSLDEGQVRALRAVHRSVDHHHNRWSYDSHLLGLSDLPPEGWLLLQRAVDRGVELIPDPDHTCPVSARLLAEPVWCGLVLGTDADGSVGLHARVAGAPEHARVSPLGRPAAAVAWREGPELVIAPTLDELDDLTATLLRDTDPIRVPPEEVDEFIDEFLPRLEQATTLRHPGEVGSEPGGVEPVERVRLHLRVTPLADAQVQIDQHLAYGEVMHPVALERAFIGRRRREEREVVGRLESYLVPYGLMEVVGGLGWWPVEQATLGGMDAVRLCQALEDVAALEDVVLDLVDELPTYDEITAEPLIEVGTREGAGGADTDWFDLHVAVSLDGEQVPFEPLFQALVRGDAHMLLASGSYFALDHPSLHRLREVIAEAREMEDRQGETTRINRFQVGLWEELVALGVVGEQARAWEQSVERLRTLDQVLAPDPPEGLQAQLRPYQQDGYAWLATLWDVGLGGILADDMGLGKTVQVLALLERARAAGELTEPVLVVAPTSMVGTWVAEAARFTPGLRVRAVGETSAKRGRPLAEVVREVDVVVTTYAVLRLDAESFHALPWRGLVLDEAQAIKNHQSKTYQAVRRVRAPFRLAMSGTPLENSLMDLWSLLSVSAPGLYPRPDEFTRVYRKPIESGDAPDRLDRLRRRIRPLVLRRTKGEVAADLPAKQVQVSNVPLAPVHARVYEQHLQRERQRVLGLLDDPESNRVAILAALTRLRQLALDPSLVDESFAGSGTSAKLAALVEHVQELAAEGHRALVFSQFTRYLHLAREALERAGLATCYLDGGMPAKARATEIESFRAGDAPAFLISLKAGGTGLTLTEADYVFVLDPWWNPATEAQAIDRTHRIGQTKPVMVYRLVSQGTIEDKVVALQERKRDLFDKVLGEGGALSGALSADDVRGLLDL